MLIELASFVPPGSTGSGGPLLAPQGMRAMAWQQPWTNSEFLISLYEHTSGFQYWIVSSRARVETVAAFQLRHGAIEDIFDASPDWVSINLEPLDPALEFASVKIRSHWKKQRSDGTWKYRTLEVEKKSGESTEAFLRRVDKEEKGLEDADWESIPPQQQEASDGGSGGGSGPPLFLRIQAASGANLLTQDFAGNVVVEPAGAVEISNRTELGNLLIDVMDASDAASASGGSGPLSLDIHKAMYDFRAISAGNIYTQGGVYVVLYSLIDFEEDSLDFWDRHRAAEDLFEAHGWRTIDPDDYVAGGGGGGPEGSRPASGPTWKRVQQWSKPVRDDDGNVTHTRHRTTIVEKAPGWSFDKWEFYGDRTQTEMFESGWVLESTNEVYSKADNLPSTRDQELRKAA